MLRQVLESGEWQIVIPLTVINDLDGLKVNPPPLGTAVAEAITLVEQSLSARKLRVVTAQGTGLATLDFRAQQLLSKNTEDGAGNIDAFIIETVRDQAEKHTGKAANAEKAVLVTGDRSMRVIAKARGVQALSGGELRKVLSSLRKGDATTMAGSPKKKVWS